MGKTFKQRRIEYIHSWPNTTLFPMESVYLNRYRSIKDFTYKAFQYQKDDEYEYNIVLSYVIDALQNMPSRPDLAFDFYWKAVDKYLVKVIPSNFKTITERLKYAINNILVVQISGDSELEKLVEDMIKSISKNSLKYLYKRIFDGFENVRAEDQSVKSVRQVLLRIEASDIRNKGIYEVLKYMNNQYGYDSADYINTILKGTNFMKRLLKGEEIKLISTIEYNHILTDTIQIDNQEQINLIINGVLYSFRNDRFHGSLISPFTSSTTTMQTYAHCFYSLLWAELIVLLLLEVDNKVNINEVICHCRENLSFYQRMF